MVSPGNSIICHYENCNQIHFVIIIIIQLREYGIKNFYVRNRVQLQVQCTYLFTFPLLVQPCEVQKQEKYIPNNT